MSSWDGGLSFSVVKISPTSASSMLNACAPSNDSMVNDVNCLMATLWWLKVVSKRSSDLSGSCNLVAIFMETPQLVAPPSKSA